MKKTLLTLTFIMLFKLVSMAQQTCSTALTMVDGIGTTPTITGTEVPTQMCASGGSGATAANWYKYSPLLNYSVTITTDFPANSGIDNRVHVYSGSCGSLTCVAGDDDSGPGALCLVTFNANAGTDYYIVFDNIYTSAGFQYEMIENPVNPSPLTFTPVTMSTIVGNYKLALTDMNGDYLDDIVSVSDTNIQVHQQDLSGTFTIANYTTSEAQFSPGWSMAIGDLNEDGFNDLLYGSGSGVTFMLSANGGTSFNQVSGPEYVFSQRSNMVDIDNDGHLDAFVCHDVAPNVYYLNDGTGNLTYHQGGLGDHPNGGNYGSIWVDYNNDHLPDLFIAKCRGGSGTANINEMHRNNGNGTFTDVSIATGLADPVQTWSSAWNDFDNDGWMDVIVGASSSANGMHKFMHNNGDETFTDITSGSGIDSFPGLSTEYASYDFNNDGFADVLTPGYILFNNGNGTFTSQAYSMSMGAVGDLNNDGFLDIQNGNTIYYNDGNNRNWLTVTLKGTTSNKNGIGARVEIYGPWGKQIRDIRAGVGFRYMGTLNAHFGISYFNTIDSVVVKWTSGNTDVICNPTINSVLHIEENSAPVPTSSFTVSASDINMTDVVDFTDNSSPCPYEWNWSVNPSSGWNFTNGTTATSENPSIAFNDAGNYVVSLTATNGNGPSANLYSSTITVQNVVGIADLTQGSIKVFPNPAADLLYLKSDQTIREVKIVSVLGAEVASTLNRINNSISLTHLPAGVYFLQIMTQNDQTQITRLVKQ
ncbi:MAG: VCBS repeat-containing protein [Bacteroidetes bacterium]|nr:VCBS repeat-containing protein [Bacteroidota bacterium]MBP6476723.1 VCBS repeat-containing protein [Chitinophagaceae bacterium]